MQSAQEAIISVALLSTSAAGQDVIASYKIGGEQLFFPNAAR
jgi:ABC-type tungstate transport system permease subunit